MLQIKPTENWHFKSVREGKGSMKIKNNRRRTKIAPYHKWRGKEGEVEEKVKMLETRW